MVISVRHTHICECFSSICRFHKRSIQYVNHILILWVSKNVDIIPTASDKNAVAINTFETFSSIIRTKKPTFFSFRDYIHTFRICSRYTYISFSHCFWKAFGQFIPSVSTISRFINTATISTAAHLPWLALVIPKCRIKNTWIIAIHTDSASTSMFIYI